MNNMQTKDEICTRTDCKWFSSYTTTCDYRLYMFRARGCPVSECDKYVPRDKERKYKSFAIIRAEKIKTSDRLIEDGPAEVFVETQIACRTAINTVRDRTSRFEKNAGDRIV